MKKLGGYGSEAAITLYCNFIALQEEFKKEEPPPEPVLGYGEKARGNKKYTKGTGGGFLPGSVRDRLGHMRK